VLMVVAGVLVWANVKQGWEIRKEILYAYGYGWPAKMISVVHSSQVDAGRHIYAKGIAFNALKGRMVQRRGVI